MDSGNKTVIFVDNRNIGYEFDKLDEKRVDTSISMTEHPVVTGDLVADHIYRNPTNLSLSGTFSLNGFKAGGIQYVGQNRLTAIQKVFEEICHNGVKCRIVTMKRNNEGAEQFKVRTNMVLTNISWKENQNSVDINLTFREAITIDESNIEILEDETDPNLPALTDPNSLDFTDTLLDWSVIDKLVIEVSQQLGFLTQEFLQYYAQSYATITSGVILAAGTIAAISAIASGVSAIPGGIVVVAAVGAVALIGWGIYKLFKTITTHIEANKFKEEQFRLYKDDRKNEQEVIRFTNFISNIHNELEQLEDVIKLYGFASNENQECSLYLDNEYYTFIAMKDINGYYSLKVSSLRTQNNTSVINTSISRLEGLSSIADCKLNNALFRTIGKGSYVYIMNVKLAEIENATYKSYSEKQKAIDEAKKDLTNMMILVSSVNMEQFNNLVTDIIKNAILI